VVSKRKSSEPKFEHSYVWAYSEVLVW